MTAAQTVLLIRHATPDRTRRDLPYHLPPGPPLVAQGEQEAALLGEFLRYRCVRQLYASPLERCQRTAQLAAQISGAQVHTSPELIEWQPGDTSAAIQARMLPLFEQAARSDPDSPVGLVSHGGPIGALLLALGMSEATLQSHRIYDSSNPLPPAGIWQAHRPNPGAPWQLKLIFTPAWSTQAI